MAGYVGPLFRRQRQRRPAHENKSEHGVGHYDALHVASAMAGKADLFVTTDDHLIKKIREVGGLPVMLPGEALAFLENWYEN